MIFSQQHLRRLCEQCPDIIFRQEPGDKAVAGFGIARDSRDGLPLLLEVVRHGEAQGFGAVVGKIEGKVMAVGHENDLVVAVYDVADKGVGGVKEEAGSKRQQGAPADAIPSLGWGDDILWASA